MSPSLLYLKPLRNSNTFLHVIYKSKKKTNLLCILNNVFQYSKIRKGKRNAKKSIKTEKNLESSPFWNPESAIQYLESGIHRVESRIQYCYGFPYMGRKGQIQRCQHTMTVKKFIKNVRRKSASTSNYYKRLLSPNS